MQDIVLQEFIRLVDSGEIINRLREQRYKLGSFEHPTLGGHFCWKNLVVHKGWRIQQNNILKHQRILDPDDYCYYSGTPKFVSECILGSHRPKAKETFTEFKRLIDEGTLMARLAEQPSTNIEMSVMDAEKCWDVLVVHKGWKIEQHKVGKNCRILNPAGERVAWGSYDYLMKRIQGQSVNPVVNYLRKPGSASSPFTIHRASVRSKKGIVFLVHGWGVGESSMEKLANALCTLGYDTFCYDYRSSQQTITGLASDLYGHFRAAMDTEKGPFFILTHSMGGLLTRKVLEMDRANAISNRIEQVVMLGPPNQGSVLADIAALFLGGVNHSIGGMQTSLESEVNQIGKPAHYQKKFGIIGGDFDGKVVPKSSLAIPGRHDEIVFVTATHPGLCTSMDALNLVCKFFENGTFQ